MSNVSRPLVIYLVFVAFIFSGYLYLQLNGIQVFSSTKTEHEGQEGTYGSGSGNHTRHHYYHNHK